MMGEVNCIIESNLVTLLPIEKVVFSHFEDFKRENNGQSTFNNFKEILAHTNLQHLYNHYPVAEKLLQDHHSKRNNISSMVETMFSIDKIAIQQNIVRNDFHLKIENIETGVGDFHKGLSTAILYLDKAQKMVFKPTNAAVSESFFEFLSWLNSLYDLGNYRFKIIGKEGYQWLEFVNQEPCQSISDLKLYYERAGFMLGVLYILNASDFHHENIIAHKTTPVFIDHETIIQPKINQTLQMFFKNFLAEEVEDSVIETALLPNHYDKVQTMPIGTCGYGYHKQKSMQTLKKEAVDRFTDNWRFVTRFAEESFQKENLPIFHEKAVYPNEYLKEFITGFEKAYHLMLEQRSFLLNDNNSPLQKFQNKKIRFIWRATNVYAKIFNQMKLPKNLKDEKLYEQKIRDYLFVAYKNVPGNSDLMYIYQQEVAEMMRGDIPYFEVNSSSRDLETEFGTIKDFFELSAVENIERKLKKLSLKDLELQKKLIFESYKQ